MRLFVLMCGRAGGLSHLSNAYGWVSQNVIAYEVMLANGSVVTASATENADLYHGVKAANNNFGKPRILCGVYGGSAARSRCKMVANKESDCIQALLHTSFNELSP